MAIATPHPPTPQDIVLPALEGVTAREDLNDVSQKLAEIRVWLMEDLRGMEQALQGASQGSDLAERSAAHLLASPGKRIRPLCVMLASRIGESVNTLVVRDLAVACELVHTATLLHDDVIDEGTERRGRTTARMVYGNTASVLGGDHLLVEALKRVHNAGKPELMSSMLEVISSMVRAEAIQLAHRGDFVPDKERYFSVVNGKTASLFHWAMDAGALISGASHQQRHALAEAGRLLGVAFQLIDDTLDLAGDANVIGKDLCVDLREGKLTWPLIVACEREPELQEAIASIVRDPNSEGLSFLAQRIIATGCIEATRRKARDVATEAGEHLNTIPPSPVRDALSAVVNSAISRAK